jgi:diguanylate cyclase (GGDEF)-like protein
VLLAAVLMVHGLITAMWWAAGSRLGLARRPASHWAVAAAANGLALSLLPLSQLLPLPTAIPWAQVCVVLGIVCTRRGLQAFLRLRHTDGSHLLMVGGMACVNLMLCGPLGWQSAGEALSSALVALVLWRTAWENHQPLAFEFNEALSRLHSGVLGAAGAVFMAGALVQAVPPLHQGWLSLHPEQRTFLLVFSHLVLSIATSFLLGYMVVMRLVNKLEHLSHHDSLTGLLNRRAIEYLLDREIQRLQRFGEGFSVLIVDIDHFKRINDRLGHAAGDVVLCAVAKALQAQAREVDRVARFGGEEFCVILPHTLHEGALQAAERLRDAIRALSIDWQDEVISVTVSTGVATAHTTDDALDDLLQRADEALYRAKEEGRNRVVAARPRLVA